MITRLRRIAEVEPLRCDTRLSDKLTLESVYICMSVRDFYFIQQRFCRVIKYRPHELWWKMHWPAHFIVH